MIEPFFVADRNIGNSTTSNEQTLLLITRNNRKQLQVTGDEHEKRPSIRCDRNAATPHPGTGADRHIHIQPWLVVMAQTSKSTAVKNIVVVHGAFADGSGWEGVHAILTKDGYTVTIVQNPLISLEGDVAATKRAIANLSGPVILVGHSYGGAVIRKRVVIGKLSGSSMWKHSPRIRASPSPP
jgi:pimeloyl-ACP methyl ester carboxylesterase